MPLTEDESRRLAVIERQLRASDHRLERVLTDSTCGPSKDSRGPSTLHKAAMGTGLLAAPLLVLGVTFQIPLLAMVGWLLIVAWIVLRCIDGW